MELCGNMSRDGIMPHLWQIYHNRKPVRLGIFGADVAMMQLNSPSTDGETDPGAAGLAGSRVIDPIKWVEQIGQGLFGHAGAMIQDCDLDAISVAGGVAADFD